MAAGDEVRAMGATDLLSAYGELFADKYSDTGVTWNFDYHAMLHDELLRRLSAGNPQAEKVQISEVPRGRATCPVCGRTWTSSHMPIGRDWEIGRHHPSYDSSDQDERQSCKGSYSLVVTTAAPPPEPERSDGRCQCGLPAQPDMAWCCAECANHSHSRGYGSECTGKAQRSADRSLEPV